MEITRIFDIPYYQFEEFPKTDALNSKVNGIWKNISTQEYISTSEILCYGFINVGLQPGDTVATISKTNRIEWNFIDMAIQLAGAVHVPVYPTISDDDYKFIFNDAEVKYVFVSDEELYKKVIVLARVVNTIERVYTFDEIKGIPNWKMLLKAGEENPLPDKVKENRANIKPGELATIIYTSGTTGTPKGVMLSHHNITSNVTAAHPLVPFGSEGRALSFLPLCHVYERMINYLYQSMGISIYYAESIEKIGENLKEIKPDIFVAVPRVIEKTYDKILNAGNLLKGIKRRLFFWAISLGFRYEHNHVNGVGYDIKLWIARKLVFVKLKEAVGGNLKLIVSGGAALQVQLARLFWAAGIPILEGYGLTETSPVIAVNFLKKGSAHFGTVGPILSGVEVKLAEDSEILCKGPNVMMGYYKRPDLTRDVIDSDGWFHTGDVGVMVENKFLRITDRKKELLKTSGGKYIAPQPIENLFKTSPKIEQVMIVGDGEKFTGAIIVPNFNYLEGWCKSNGIAYTSKNEIIQKEKVKDMYKEEVDKLNKNIGHIEQVKRFELLADEWTAEDGELTPTLKLKRKFIMNKYKTTIDKIYDFK